MNNIDWKQILINASIASMQGLQENGKISLLAEADPKVLAKLSVKIAKELVNELKKEIEQTNEIS